MKTQIFAIYDSTLKLYQQPHFCINRGHALRMVQDIMDRGDSPLSKHSNDFTLFELGEYDDETGKLKSLATPEKVAGCWELKPPESNVTPIAKGH